MYRLSSCQILQIFNVQKSFKVLGFRQFCTNKINDNAKKVDKDVKIDFDELSEKLEESLKQSKEGKVTEVDKNFMNFASSKQREDEREKNRKKMIGKANIGGEWELVNVDGKLEGSKDFLGKWVLIYFGFTNCPDICPEEIEKMIDVVDDLQRDENSLSITPIFISVDPVRDTTDRVRKYCAEFSPKLQGFTGSKEQIDKVTKAFRVYHSEGPKTNEDDYIVDHTVIMYLIDPLGEFHDYYGQNRRSGEIANVIRAKSLKYEMSQRNSKSWL